VRRFAVVCLTSVAVLAAAAPAGATPTATTEAEYMAYDRVFPDPLAGCTALSFACSPNAQGTVPATQFIQYTEFVDSLKYMNKKDEWKRYLEVWPLDGKLGSGWGRDEPAAFPGNNLGRFEFTPKPHYESAGLPTSTLDRKKSDLFVLRVTDETVPDAHKKRMTLSLSIHGIERAGLEGGTRAMEDFVTAATTGRKHDPIVPAEVTEGAPTFAEVLKKTIIYFTYPNPDGWRRGAVSEGGVFFQRYNGNGVDPNRDYPDIGYSFRGYSGGSEPETRAFLKFYEGVRSRGGDFAAGDDLHGQPYADALSYTLLPHGRHDLAKDARLREAAKQINRAQYEATKWSPIIQDNDEPVGGGAPCVPGALGDTCAQIYAQTWGSVYDTINYTTTGTLGDWFDSSIGLKADGIDNEMSFSHLDKNIVFDPHTEQLHVDGNKSLIYSHLADILNPITAKLNAPGPQGYVPNRRLRRETKTFKHQVRRTHAQKDIEGQVGTADPAEGGKIVIPFQVKRVAPPPNSQEYGIYNGGMRVDVTTPNAQGVGTGSATLQVQCRGCDDRHANIEPDEGWTTIAEDYNQSQIYAQSGVTAAVNRPQANRTTDDGRRVPVEWRALVSLPAGSTGTAKMNVDFTGDPATADATRGSDPDRLRGYDVANTDFFADLNNHIPDPADRFRTRSPRRVLSGEQTLNALDTLVLADEALPGYTGKYEGEVRGSGPPTESFGIAHETPTTPGQGAESCRRDATTTENRDFTIDPADGNSSLRVHVQWALETNDWDLFLQRKVGDEYEDVKSSAGFIGTSEEVLLEYPAPGEWRVQVVNCSAADQEWTGTVSFKGIPQAGASSFTRAEKDAWMKAVREWVKKGNTLVLTDGALRALGDLTDLPGDSVRRQTVYTGQMTFATSDDEAEMTVDDPLAEGVDQPGARFNSGFRRQVFEPTPLGFAIQNKAGDDQSFARQYDIHRGRWQDAGGRTAATSANAGARDAEPVYDRVTLGEIPLGQGRIRVAGAMLPQPSEQYDHPLGLEPYAVTYTGYIVMCNLLGATCETSPKHP